MRGSTVRSGSNNHSGQQNSRFATLVRQLPSAQKSAVGAPAYSRFVNRRAGGYLAVLGHLIGATPNQVTFVSALCTFGGILTLLLAPPTWLVGILVCAALLLGYALDSADGQLARLRGGGDPSGEWLDHVVDSAKIPTLHLAVMISVHRFGEQPEVWLFVPIGFAIVESVLFFAMMLNEQLRRWYTHSAPRNHDSPSAGASPWVGDAIARKTPSLLRSLAVAPTDYGTLCLAFALLGVQAVFASVYTVLFLAHLGFLCLALPNWFRRMRDPASDEKKRR